MDKRLNTIRANERESHIEIYKKEKLYETKSWLGKPVKTIEEITPLFKEYNELKVLDLGCGVGRNSIFIAEKYRKSNCIIECVDLLEIAIEKLQQNAREHNVSSHIKGIIKSIEEYDIRNNTYDFIMAVSALEHIDTQESFVKKLREIEKGVRKNGIVCLIINSNVREVNFVTGEHLDAQFEVNFDTEKLNGYLLNVFKEWNKLKMYVSNQEYNIPRGEIISHLKTDVVTFVARKNI